MTGEKTNSFESTAQAAAGSLATSDIPTANLATDSMASTTLAADAMAPAQMTPKAATTAAPMTMDPASPVAAECSLGLDSRAVESRVDALHRLKEVALSDDSFAAELRVTRSTAEAATLAGRHGITIPPAALWRHRGTLIPGGLPTWPG